MMEFKLKNWAALALSTMLFSATTYAEQSQVKAYAKISKYNLNELKYYSNLAGSKLSKSQIAEFEKQCAAKKLNADSCVVWGLSLKQSFDKELYRSNFTSKLTFRPLAMMHSEAFVMSDALADKYALTGPYSIVIQGQKIYENDYVDVNYQDEDLIGLMSGNAESPYYFMNRISSIKVLRSSPRIQCAGLKNGKLNYLNLSAGESLLTYGPSSFMRLEVCDPNEIGHCSNPLISGISRNFDSQSSQLSLMGDLNNYVMNINISNRLMDVIGKDFFAKRSAAMANHKADRAAKKAEAFRTEALEYDVQWILKSSASFSQLPVTRKYDAGDVKQFVTSDEAKNLKANASFEWNYSLYGMSSPSLSDKIEMTCSTWN